MIYTAVTCYMCIAVCDFCVGLWL